MVKSGSISSKMVVCWSNRVASPPVATTFDRPADLRLHPRHQPFHHRHIAPVDADMHLVLGGSADHREIAVRRLDGDSRQLGRGGDQGVERQVDARRDDPAFIGARIIDRVEGGGGAEIDDDQIAFVKGVGGDRVEHPVGADAPRLGDVELDPPFRPAPGRRSAARP